MRIPDKEGDRIKFVQEVLQKCIASQEDRRSAYRTLKEYYLFGCEGGANQYGTMNKIYPHIDQAVSFLYSQDTTRFAVDLDKSVSELELLKVPALNEAVNDTWHSSDIDLRFGDALTWAHVYGSMFLKPRWHIDHLIADVVEPHNVGLWREDVFGMDNQEAFSHSYKIPKSQLFYELTVANHPDAESIVNEAVANDEPPSDAAAQPIDRIITSSAMPDVIGELNTALGARLSYVPKSAEPMVMMQELFIYDDDIADFRIFTIANPFVIVYDRPISRIYVANEVPLIQVCPYPLHDYAWGMSIVERLIPIQSMRNTRWDQIQHLMELQAVPPSAGSGFEGNADEMQDALDTPGGLVLSDNPGAKMERLPPTIPPDLLDEFNFYDDFFNEVTGTTKIMSGQGESGVRSEGQASQLLRVGASRTKRRALIVEDNLEEVSTLVLKLLKKYSKKKYRSEDGVEFIADQFTDEFIVRVDAHSNSPVFMQDMSQMAFALFKAKAIDRAELLELLQVPMKDLLKLKLKTKIEPAEAKAKEAENAAIAQGKVTKLAGKGKS